jgi:hypothetical protein
MRRRFGSPFQGLEILVDALPGPLAQAVIGRAFSPTAGRAHSAGQGFARGAR